MPNMTGLSVLIEAVDRDAADNPQAAKRFLSR
jgi:hypothetical protein